jgi:hypothetical protein
MVVTLMYFTHGFSAKWSRHYCPLHPQRFLFHSLMSSYLSEMIAHFFLGNLFDKQFFILHPLRLNILVSSDHPALWTYYPHFLSLWTVLTNWGLLQGIHHLIYPSLSGYFPSLRSWNLHQALCVLCLLDCF